MNQTKLFGILLLSCALVSISVFVYLKYVRPRLNAEYTANKEFVNVDSAAAEEEKFATIYYFETEWCPHCKKSKPIWNEFKAKFEDSAKINNYTLLFSEVDCDTDEAKANEFDVQGFPTIKMRKDNEIIEYDAKPNANTLENFVKTVLADE